MLSTYSLLRIGLHKIDLCSSGWIRNWTAEEIGLLPYLFLKNREEIKPYAKKIFFHSSSPLKSSCKSISWRTGKKKQSEKVGDGVGRNNQFWAEYLWFGCHLKHEFSHVTDAQKTGIVSKWLIFRPWLYFDSESAPPLILSIDT